MAIAALGARIGLTTGFAMLQGLLFSWLVPVEWAGVAFVLVAATTWPAYFWVWGKLFRKAGIRV